MGALNILLVLAGAFLVFDYATAAPNAGLCPPKNKVHTNTPVCHSDADCQKYGKICCPNQYNTKSCTDRAPFAKYEQKKSMAGSHRGAGVYCDGVKCNPWEVCKPDRFTKKLRCQPA